MILILLAHPYPHRSRACAALVDAVRDLPSIEVRSLYDLYPDFDIDRGAEQAALARAQLVVWLHPLFWYTVPALMKHWFDDVLVRGFAYGEGGGALGGREVLWAVTTGGDDTAFSAQGRHMRPFDDFVPVVEQVARYCGLHWLDPFVVKGAHEISDDVLREAGRAFRERLASWRPHGEKANA